MTELIKIGLVIKGRNIIMTYESEQAVKVQWVVGQTHLLIPPQEIDINPLKMGENIFIVRGLELTY